MIQLPYMLTEMPPSEAYIDFYFARNVEQSPFETLILDLESLLCHSDFLSFAISVFNSSAWFRYVSFNVNIAKMKTYPHKHDSYFARQIASNQA